MRTYIPNGSGLFPVLNPSRPTAFSVSDGTGYTPRRPCAQTGFAVKADRLIFMPDGGSCAQTGLLWTQLGQNAKYHTTDLGFSTVFVPLLFDYGDQWTFGDASGLKIAHNMAGDAGVAVGVQTRWGIGGGFAGNGYYLSRNKFPTGGGGFIEFYETGIMAGTGTIVMDTYPPVLDVHGDMVGGLLMKVTGGPGPTPITITNYVISTTDFLNQLYDGFVSLFTLGTWTLGIGSPNRFVTGKTALYGTSGSAFPDFTEGFITNWTAGDIGNC